jgi:hypothetical protein
MKFQRTAAFVIGGLLPLIAGSVPANASTVDFDWTLTGPAASLGGFQFTGSGTLTAQTTATPGVDLVTAMTGEVSSSTIENAAITLLAVNAFQGNNNLLFPNGVTATNPTVLNGGGLSFAITAGDINIFSFGGTGTGNAYGQISPSGFGVGHFEVSATPLPAALPLFAGGLGALGLLGWRRKRKAAALAA